MGAVAEELGLRERKKRQTREAIAAAAFALFRERGFDGVSVADIAAAAEVSKPTLFAYFPTKEDLVLHRFVDGSDGPALVVRERPAGTSALHALRTYFLDLLARRDLLSGLNDTPTGVTFHALLYTTPSLLPRLTSYLIDRERKLAEELLATGEQPDEFTARLVAAQVFGAQRILAEYNAAEIRAGRGADEVYPAAVARAETAFDMLEP